METIFVLLDLERHKHQFGLCRRKKSAWTRPGSLANRNRIYGIDRGRRRRHHCPGHSPISGIWQRCPPREHRPRGRRDRRTEVVVRIVRLIPLSRYFGICRYVGGLVRDTPSPTLG